MFRRILSPPVSCSSPSSASPPSSPSTHRPHRRSWRRAIRFQASAMELRRAAEGAGLKARDGAPLNYRLYPGRPDRVVVLVHGSSGTDAACSSLPRRCRRPAPASTRSACAAMAAAAPQRRRLLSRTARRRPGRPRQRPRPRQARHTSHARRLLLRRRLRAAHRRRQAGRPVRRLSRDLALHRAGLAHQQAELRRLGRRGRTAHRRAVAARRLRPAVVPGFARRPLRHRRQGQRQPHAGLLLPAGREPAARPRLACRLARIGAPTGS